MVEQQFVFSYELLQLLRWLKEHEQELLKKLVARALHRGLALQLRAPDREKEDIEEIQEAIVEFFALLEEFLDVGKHEENAQEILRSNTIPTLKYLDTAHYDTQALDTSISKAEEAFTKQEGDTKEILCRELLRRWRPSIKKPEYQ